MKQFPGSMANAPPGHIIPPGYNPRPAPPIGAVGLRANDEER